MAKQEKISFESNPVKKRLLTMLSYDWTRLPRRVASSIQADLSHVAWSDNDAFYYGTGNPEAPIATESLSTLHDMERHLPNAYYRNELNFYPVKRAITHGTVKLSPLTLDAGYSEFFIDILAGTLGIYRGSKKPEMWRRYGRITEKIEKIEDFYGVSSSKQCAGVDEIAMDMMNLYPELAPLRVVSGLAIGETVFGGLGQEPLADDMIPKHIMPKAKLDVEKARNFFNLICPDEASQHNLLLATVYPYFKRSNEHFFIIKGVGGTGKSRYMEHFEVLLGNKFCGIDLMGLASTGYEKSSAIARLQGKLVLHAPDSKMEAASKFVHELKRLATGDYMVGRTIGNNSTAFKPDGVLFIDTNDRVELENTEDIIRRRVGVIFRSERLTHKEFEPYYKWVETLDGAASIFLYAYSYLQDECYGGFFWNNVDVNEGEEFPPIVKDAALSLMAMYENDKNAFVLASELDSVPRIDKSRFLAHYGLKSATKRFGKSVKRIFQVDNHELFAERIRETNIQKEE